MKSKNEYIEQLASQLREWSLEIDLLTAKTQEAAALAKLNYAEELEALNAKRRTAEEKLKELEAASWESWESLKDTADIVWDELRSGVSHAVAKLK